MQITQELVQKSNGLLVLKDEINDWTGKKFQMFNTGSVEVETAEFLYAMVRLTKPTKILDTGTHYGVSAAYMAKACQDNGFGSVLSCEIDERYIKEAKQLWIACGLNTLITQFHGKSFDVEKQQFDFMLLDTEPQIRFQELVKFFPMLAYGGFVFIHDLHRHMSQEQSENGFGWPFGELPTQIKNWVKDGELRPMHFPTPRGFMGFYKPREDDFKWF